MSKIKTVWVNMPYTDNDKENNHPSGRRSGTFR